MATALRPIGHEERLSLVDHLDELRTRIIVSLVAFSVVFGLCFWQNGPLLKVVDAPYKHATAGRTASGPLGQVQRAQPLQRQKYQSDIRAYRALAQSARLEPATRALMAKAARDTERLVAALPRRTEGRPPVTLGVGEPFVTTFTVTAYFALLITLPILLYQLYAFVLPAFNRREREVALPLMLMAPFLFVGGVAFGYFVVLPAALRFLLNFNADQFDILVQARDYYRFAALALISIGILFQIPVGILALTRLGIVTPAQLRQHRRYAVLAIAVLAMLLPGTDPVTMLVSMVPLVVLYEGSILLASLLARRERRLAGSEPNPLETNRD